MTMAPVSTEPRAQPTQTPHAVLTDSLLRNPETGRRQRIWVTQEELAERARLSARGVNDLERGLRRNPYPSTIRQLATALDLP
jgi:DNA-binding XRE family transcriptional regulator